MTQQPTTADRPNDVTLKYTVQGQLGKLASKWERELDGEKGALVSGEGSTGKFENGYWTGDENVTVSKTFTISMEHPAWKVQKMVDEFEAFAGGSTTVEIDSKGSFTGQPPRYTDAGNVIPGGSTTVPPEEERTHTGYITVTTDVTKWMTGEN